MTLFEPAMQVQRLVVAKGGAVAYDESFHSGVNIIRGENSSGKSSVLNLLVHGLGADITQWSEHALLCDRVYVEAKLNNKVVTLARDIAREAGRPMDIFGGSYDEASAAPPSAWRRYPYRSSSNQESFSQAVFRLLDLPELETEASGKLTLHQILRVLYSDQLSPVENIFRFERFDSPILREAVGRLLCGAYEGELYRNELRIKELEKELTAISAALGSMYAVLGQVKHSLTVDWLSAQEATLSRELAGVQSETEAAEQALFEGGAGDRLTLDAQRSAFEEVQTLQARLGSLETQREMLRLEMADSEAFIGGLQSKLAALEESSLVASQIGAIEFLWCPSCFAALDAAVGEHACQLCKAPYDDERLRTRIVNLINDIGIQLKQSRLLQQARDQELREVERDERRTEQEWRLAADRLSSLQRLPSSAARARLRELSQRAGYLERQIEDLNEKAGLIVELERLSETKARLTSELSRLQDRNTVLRNAEKNRLSKAYTLIADIARDFLRRDLPRQDTFQTARQVQFSFATDKLSVDGQSYFSASSLVILKNSFLSGFLFAATEDQEFRHPRLAIMDTIEDKGMEPERSQNFQKLIAQRSRASEVEHQIIFATAMIAPELDTAEYTVGKLSTHESPTLAVS